MADKNGAPRAKRLVGRPAELLVRHAVSPSEVFVPAVSASAPAEQDRGVDEWATRKSLPAWLRSAIEPWLRCELGDEFQELKFSEETFDRAVAKAR